MKNPVTQNNSSAKKTDLTTGDVSAHLVRMSLPMIWGIMAIVSFQLVDTYFISMLGAEPLAAISFTFPVTFAIFSLMIGLGIAVSSVLSRTIGEGNQDKVKRITSHSLIFAFLFGVIVATLGDFFMQPVFGAMGADSAMQAIIHDYMHIWFIGIVFLVVPMVGNSAMRAGGDTRTPALIMLGVALINVVLDPILIFGLFGFPRMEVQGAALATMIANLVAMLIGLYVILIRKKMICRDGLHIDQMGDTFRRLIVIALPVGLTQIFQPFVNGIIIALLAQKSNAAVAAFGVVSRLEAFAFIVIMALATGMGPVIGQNWGAKLYHRVKETLRKTIGFAFIWSFGVGLFFIVFGRIIAAMFSDDPLFMNTVQMYFWIIGLSYAFGNLVQGWTSAFNAMGMPKRAFVMIFVRLFILQVPLAFAGAYYLGVAGIFVSIALTNFIAGAGFHLYNRRICDQKACD